jgi:DNA-binding transcriptional regulator YiaG
MAKGHSYLWRKPGRRNEERKRFRGLMKRVESRRLKLGMSKTELAHELNTTTDALRAWLTGRTIGRKETVAKIRVFS